MRGQRAVRMSRRIAIAIIGLAVATVTVPIATMPRPAFAATCSPPTFAPRTTLGGATDPQDVVAADLNADGRPDLVAANFQGSVTAFLNDGSGAFGAGMSSASGGATGVNYHVRAGDFDEDGKVDAAVVQPYDNQVEILRGDGGGHFAASTAAAAGAFPTSLAVADVDGDTHLDIVVTSATGNSVSVLYGTGDGTFAAPAGVAFNNLSFGADIALGDLDGNGYLDIVAASMGADRVLTAFNSGARSFTQHDTLTVHDGPYRLGLGDMNRDGNLDIVVGYFSDNRISVLPGKGGVGSPAFGPVADVDQGSPTDGLSLGDADGDGTLDVVTVGLPPAFTTFPDFVHVLTNAGTGALTVATTIDVPNVTEAPDSVATGYFDSDGTLDIADTDYLDAAVSVFKGTCAIALHDIEATGLEVTQAIQDLANDVVLIEGRRTFVRAYAKGDVALDGVTARLVRIDASGAVIDRPLWPANPGAEITVGTAPDRKRMNDAFLFELPETWTHGQLRLRFEVNPGRIPSESGYANNVTTRTLSFQQTNVMKIELIPVKAHIGGTDPGCNRDTTPDTAQLDMIESSLKHQLPASSVKVTRAPVLDSGLTFSCIVGGPTSDAADATVAKLKDVYAGAARDRIRVGIFVQGGTAGVADPDLINLNPIFNPQSGWFAASTPDPATVVHEVAHDMGRMHVASPQTAPCSASKSPAGLDTLYPYPAGRIGGPTGTEKFVGFEPGDASLRWPTPRGVVGPETGDVLTYCQNRWPSDYTWTHIRDVIQTKFTPADPTGDFLVVTGALDTSTGTASAFAAVRRSQLGGFQAPPAGSYHLRQLDASNNVLADTAYAPYLDHDGNPTVIDMTVNFAPGTRKIELRDATNHLWGAIAVSASAPVVANVALTTGAIPSSGPVTVTWSRSDPDGDAVLSDVEWSNDGASFAPIASGISGTSYTADASAFTSTGGAAVGVVRVVVRDPVNTASAQTGGISAGGAAPTVRIAAPAAGATFVAGQNVALEAFANDADDGTIDSSITWTSDIDGAIGSGSHLTAVLSPGVHTLAARALDGDGNVRTRTVTVQIVGELPAQSAPPIADAGSDQNVTEGAIVTLDPSASSDPNGDALTYSWSVLQTPPGVGGVTFSGPATTPSFRADDDGTYVFRLAVSDGVYEAAIDTVAVNVANASPVVTITTPAPNTLVPNGAVTVSASFTDAGPLDAHTCTVVWDVDQGTTPVAGTTSQANRTCTATATLGAGVYTILVDVRDDDGGHGTATTQLIVYDPTAGFVTGGGTLQSPPGAYVPDPTATGTATFGFVSKYKKGTTVPSGETEFQLKTAGFRFHSGSYDWLVVAGAKAQYKGIGEVNDVSGFGFLLTATDGDVKNGGGIDRLRLKVWNATTGALVYDNVAAAPTDIDSASPQPIASGSIVIHKA